MRACGGGGRSVKTWKWGRGGKLASGQPSRQFPEFQVLMAGLINDDLFNLRA